MSAPQRLSPVLRLIHPVEMTRRDLMRIWGAGAVVPLAFGLFLVMVVFGIGEIGMVTLFLLICLVPLIWLVDKVLFFFSFWVPGLAGPALRLKGWFELRWKT